MTFTPDIYQVGREGCIRSAAVIVPAVLELINSGDEGGHVSVIDVGCGEGWFAREFAKHGCDVDAVDESVEADAIIDGVHFKPCVLPLGLTTSADPMLYEYDIAVCLEVLEHLTPDAGEETVKWMCRNADFVVWSAAVPAQGGHGHINEQWPQYWADIFNTQGFETHEELRWQIWDNDTVEPWYRQNLMLSGTPFSLDYRGLSHTLRPVPAIHPIIFDNRPIPDSGWMCKECGQRWIARPTIPNTTGCPNCGVKKEAE